MNIAYIPVCDDKKCGVQKNICTIAGNPLIYWVIKAASECKDIDRIYVATDNKKIKDVVEKIKIDKVNVIEGNVEAAFIESAMLNLADRYEFDAIVLLCTAFPLLTAADLSGGFSELDKPDTDSVLSVVRQNGLQWVKDVEGFVMPMSNYSSCGLAGQNLDEFLTESGVFYITSRNALLKSKRKLSGKIRACIMDESNCMNIDESSNWLSVEQQLVKRYRKQDAVCTGIPEIKIFLTDCDGCLTDGGMYYSENGDELKKFNTLDGMGLKLIREKGVLTGIITGEKRELNYRRSKKLCLDIFEEGVQDKLSRVKQICKEYDVDLQNVAYVGDDINDLDVVKAVGFGCSVANGIQEVKNVARYVTERLGGQGAVREIIDLLLENMKKIE